MSKIPVPQHIFVSYSRKDRQFVDRLIEDLENANIEVWFDRKGIPYESPDWEIEIREAIANAFAVLYIATPNSRESTPVYGEWRIAMERKCPVYYVLASGTLSNALRIEMMTSQIFDLSGEKYGEESPRLISLLGNLIEQRLPPEFLLQGELPSYSSRHIREYSPIQLPNGNYCMMRWAVKKPLSVVLADLYMKYLQDAITPWTYGKEWVLVNNTLSNSGLRQVIERWDWLFDRNQDAYESRREFREQATLNEFIIPLERSAPIQTWSVVTDPLSKFVIGVAFRPHTINAINYPLTFFKKYISYGGSYVTRDQFNPGSFERVSTFFIEDKKWIQRIASKNQQICII